MRQKTTILLLFHLSGYAALIYQVVWQRVLFSLYGIHTEAVAVVVAVFMLGLGVGALFGGWLSDWRPGMALYFFGFCELLIGAFGLVSLHLIPFVGRVLPHQGAGSVVVGSFLLLLWPTLLMGATLPLLIRYTTQQGSELKANVSDLYFSNTVGSGIASIATVIIFFPMLGLSGTVWLAAALNLGIGLAALLLIGNLRQGVSSE
jgi:predicted membrane-bound spermidine synthase